MSSENKFYEFPTKRSMKKMKEILEAGTIKDIQVKKDDGSVLFNVSINGDVGNLVPTIFKLPVQALGVGLSTIARIFSARVVVGQDKESCKKEDHE